MYPQEILALLVSIVGALLSQSQVAIASSTITFGVVGTILLIVGVLGLFLNDGERQICSAT